MDWHPRTDGERRWIVKRVGTCFLIVPLFPSVCGAWAWDLFAPTFRNKTNNLCLSEIIVFRSPLTNWELLVKRGNSPPSFHSASMVRKPIVSWDTKMKKKTKWGKNGELDYDFGWTDHLDEDELHHVKKEMLAFQKKGPNLWLEEPKSSQWNAVHWNCSFSTVFRHKKI